MSFQEVAGKIDLIGQTGSIPTSTFFNVGPLGSGIYVAFLHVLVTSAGSAGTVTVGITWNDGTPASVGFDSAQFSLATNDEQTAMLGNLYSAASQPITFNTAVAGAAGNPSYNLRLRLLYLG